MSTLTRPRGPLPARVYWVRRGLVLLVAAAVVVVLARLVGGGADGADSGGGPAAVPAGGTPASETSEGGSQGPGATPSSSGPAAGEPSERSSPRAGGDGTATPSSSPLPTPDGPCEEQDLVVRPVVGKAHAGSPVPLGFDLRTREEGACTWQVSPQTFTVKITSGSDDIWESRHCPKALPSREVVVRHDSRTRLRMDWGARRSDEECSNQTQWALPGWYHVHAAVLAGEPAETQFELRGPVRPVVTRTASPERQQRDASGGASPDSR